MRIRPTERLYGLAFLFDYMDAFDFSMYRLFDKYTGLRICSFQIHG